MSTGANGFSSQHPFECTISQETSSQLLDYVCSTPGVSPAAILREGPDIGVDTVYVLMARNRLYVDLYAAPLSDHQ